MKLKIIVPDQRVVVVTSVRRNATREIALTKRANFRDEFWHGLTQVRIERRACARALSFPYTWTLASGAHVPSIHRENHEWTYIPSMRGNSVRFLARRNSVRISKIGNHATTISQFPSKFRSVPKRYEILLPRSRPVQVLKLN